MTRAGRWRASGGRRRRRSLAGACSAVVVAGVVAGGVLAPAWAPVANAATAITIAQPGPLGPVSLVGDSVLVGSLLYGPSLPTRLAERGWGPIRAFANESMSAGYMPVAAQYKASTQILAWRAQGWDPVDVVVNVGTNDGGLCNGDVGCAKRSILYLVDVIGPGHRVWWPKVTREASGRRFQDAFNLALDQVVAERPNVFTWDWPTVKAVGGYQSSDGVHLSPDSYRRRSVAMAYEITASLALGARTGSDAVLPATSGEPTTYVPIAPRRVLDTRSLGVPVDAGASVEVPLSGIVPADASAVAVGLTSDGAAAAGYLTGHACGTTPGEVSNVNYVAGVPRGSFAVVPVSADLRLCVLTSARSHVIVDLQGAFVRNATGARLQPLAVPTRLADTRESGRSSELVIDAPVDATAVAVNLTATGAATPGWLRADPCSDPAPAVSNVNFRSGETVAASAFVPVSGAHSICVTSSVPVDVVVDLTAVFVASSGLRFQPVVTTRLLDTRSGVGGWSPLQGAGQALDVGVAPPGARAVTGTLTIVTPMRPGWLQAVPCGVSPTTSSVNAASGTIFANTTTVGVDAGGRMCIRSLSATQTLFDISGWWIP